MTMEVVLFVWGGREEGGGGRVLSLLDGTTTPPTLAKEAENSRDVTLLCGKKHCSLRLDGGGHRRKK